MKFNTKLLKKLLVLSATSVSIFSACSAKEDGDYKPYKEQDSIEVAKVEEEKSNPPKIIEKKSTLPKVKEDTEEPKKKKRYNKWRNLRIKMRKLMTNIRIIKMYMRTHQQYH
ncbi:hypothetical protein P9Z56_22960 [Bacillus cereus]|nr:hypothetical protein [Bacillus cereus]MEC2758311.1 hypothetical protein [Bacillus cereus]MEC2829074.1 hypothetical protein [Bacillus cereus]